MRAVEVFTPAGVPTATYVERGSQDLEQQLRNAISTPGMIASLSGPSKSGKTVLINRIIAKDDLIQISGAAIRSAEMMWDRVLTWMDVPTTTTGNSSKSTGLKGEGKVSGSAGIPLVVSGKVEGAVGISQDHGRSFGESYSRGGIDQVVREIGGSDFVLFIDDFHYMPTEIQTDVAKQLKEAAEKGVKICTASVPHRSDDVVRSNTELRGRVVAIDFEYWKPEEISEIGSKGFSALNIGIENTTVDRIAREAFGSPQLMQQMCLQACFELNVDSRLSGLWVTSIDESKLQKIFERASSTTDFSTLLDALHAGPKQRGSARNQYALVDGSVGDVYRCILLALKQDPPLLAFGYDELIQRARSVCNDSVTPVGSSLVQALEQIQTISNDIQPSAPVVEWAEDVLDIVDPYFLYYLRCSSRLALLKKS